MTQLFSSKNGSDPDFKDNLWDWDFSYLLSEVRTIKIYENIERKGEIARNVRFPTFLSMIIFFIVLINVPPILPHMTLWSANSVNLTPSKICRQKTVKCQYIYRLKSVA